MPSRTWGSWPPRGRAARRRRRRLLPRLRGDSARLSSVGYHAGDLWHHTHYSHCCRSPVPPVYYDDYSHCYSWYDLDSSHAVDGPHHSHHSHSSSHSTHPTPLVAVPPAALAVNEHKINYCCCYYWNGAWGRYPARRQCRASGPPPRPCPLSRSAVGSWKGEGCGRGAAEERSTAIETRRTRTMMGAA